MSKSRKPPTDLSLSTPLVPPPCQSSVYTLPDLDALDREMNAAEPGYVYARDAHPNARLLAARLAALEGGAWGLVSGSGMAALGTLFLATLQEGSRMVASNRLYGRPPLGRGLCPSCPLPGRGLRRLQRGLQPRWLPPGFHRT
jgi:cystathionine gamma-synthase